MLPPRPLLAASILLVGGLAWSVTALPPPAVNLADAARWEGQSVQLEGWARDIRSGPEGLRFTLVDDGYAVAVRASGSIADVPLAGDRVQAAGRLGRWQGQLRLDVEEADAVRVVQGLAEATPSWADLAQDPQAWLAKPIRLAGVVEGGRLHDGSRSVALGDGPWPSQGAVQVLGVLRDDPACLCHRLDAREVRPWRP